LLKGQERAFIHDLALYGTILCASDTETLRIYDVSNPVSPVEISELSKIQVYKMAIYGQYAYITDTEGSIIVADISTRASSQIIS
jgi:hypothetical protein